MSAHVFALRDRLREWGHASEAYAVEAKPGVEGVLPYRRLFRTLKPTDLLLLHFSMGHEVFDQLAKLQARKVDRKSTRLNSSHLVISYAVFCLKKKRTTIKPRRLTPQHDRQKKYQTTQPRAG